MLVELIAQAAPNLTERDFAWVGIAACASALAYTAKTILGLAQMRPWRSAGKAGETSNGCTQRGCCMEHSGLVAELRAVRESQMRIEDRLNQVLEDNQ